MGDLVKTRFHATQGYTLFFLLLLKNIDCRYSLEPPRCGSYNEYQQSVLSRNMKNISFLSENFQFLGVKFSIYLNSCVFVLSPMHLHLQIRPVWSESSLPAL